MFRVCVVFSALGVMMTVYTSTGAKCSDERVKIFFVCLFESLLSQVEKCLF